MSDGSSASSGQSYSALSMRPRYVLLFLLPLVLIYEAGSAWLLGYEDERLVAKRLLLGFFENFGVFGLYLPGAALVTVLVVWHLVSSDPWKIRGSVLGLMLMETIGWTFPLLMLAVLIQLLASPALAAMQIDPMMLLKEGEWQERLVLSIGAGLYEELLFRMLLMGFVHLFLVDIFQSKDAFGKVVAILASAVAFTLFHHLEGPSGQVDVARLIAVFIPGLYFAVLYLYRGFGIVVGVHALFDIVVLLILPSLNRGM